nr:hypothetical protein [uncultured Desulfobulbus sp.]
MHTDADPRTALTQFLRQPDLSILGDAIRSLPPAQWQTNMFFTGAADKELRRQTKSFPATLRKDKTTHPVFLLRASPTGHLLCPCSSKGHPRKFRFIASGCAMEMKDQVMDRDSYLIEQYPFTIPLDYRFQKQLRFFGQVPQTCIRDMRPRP